ncbi:MAG: hypothetical protein SFW65_04185 [Alphaproteobacteria bacterium]|nr:hypothetical protein [Alphaproteobacteria bacterium]
MNNNTASPAPSRPGSSSNNSSGGLPNDVALAQYLASFGERFILLLELHFRPFNEDVLKGDAQAILVAANIHHYGSEYPRDVEIIRRKLDKRLGRKGITHPFLTLQAANTPAFTAHAIDHQLVTNEEILAHVSAPNVQGKARPFYLIEKLIIEETKRKTSFKDIPEAFILNQFTGRVHRNTMNINPHGIVDIRQIFFEDVHPKVLARAVEKMGGEAAFAAKIQHEWKLLKELEARFRIEGACDALSAAYLLSILKPDERALLKFGAAHGMLTVNGASLPDQLETQAKALGQDGHTARVIVITKQDAATLHKYVAQFEKTYGIKWDARVWDYERQQHWSLREWYDTAHSIYGPSANIKAPKNTP